MYDSQVVRITCQSTRQLTKLHAITDINSKPVSVTTPNRLLRTHSTNFQPNQQPQNERGKAYNGIIHGIDRELDIDSIKEAANAISANRLKKYESGSLVETTSVILSFTDKLPEHI